MITPVALRAPSRLGRRVLALLASSVTVATALVAGNLTGAEAVTAPAYSPREFSCSGSLGEPFTQRTVTGKLTLGHVPYDVRVIQTGTGVEESHRIRRGENGGASWLHAGYVDWNVTGPNPDGNLYRLHLPPVLPGNGGFHDADLEILFAGGTAGGWQIPMFDCTVTGGPAFLSTPAGVRSFTCQGTLGEPFTQRTVTGKYTSANVPYDVRVIQTSTGTEESHRIRRGQNGGASWLHTGYVDWNVTGPNPDGNLYRLHLPPVLPAVGGFHDADLEILFAGGTAGGWQIPMFDCTVS